MSYTIPEYVDTPEQAILAVASAVKGEQVTGGDGNVGTALDLLADALAGENVEVPMTQQGAILALAQYVGGGGGGGDFTTATISLTLPNTGLLNVAFPSMFDDEVEPYSGIANVYQTADVGVVLYKGACLVDVMLDEGADPSQYSFESSGNIEQVEGAGSYIVTGDCSISVTVV